MTTSNDCYPVISLLLLLGCFGLLRIGGSNCNWCLGLNKIQDEVICIECRKDALSFKLNEPSFEQQNNCIGADKPFNLIVYAYPKEQETPIAYQPDNNFQSVGSCSLKSPSKIYSKSNFPCIDELIKSFPCFEMPSTNVAVEPNKMFSQSNVQTMISQPMMIQETQPMISQPMINQETQPMISQPTESEKLIMLFPVTIISANVLNSLTKPNKIVDNYQMSPNTQTLHQAQPNSFIDCACNYKINLPVISSTSNKNYVQQTPLNSQYSFQPTFVSTDEPISEQKIYPIDNERPLISWFTSTDEKCPVVGPAMSQTQPSQLPMYPPSKCQRPNRSLAIIRNNLKHATTPIGVKEYIKPILFSKHLKLE